MKIKNIITVSLIVFILVSCAPAAKVVPTETAVPTITSIPPTSTITPTPTPENLADAKDLSKWIDDYVHTYGGKVTVDGVEMNASQLTDEIRKNGEAFTQVKEINGVEYLFLVVNDVPLAIKQNHGLTWDRLHLRDLADNIQITDKTHFVMGSLLSDRYTGFPEDTVKLDKLNTEEFNLAILTLSANTTEPIKGTFPFLNSDGTTNLEDYTEKIVALGEKHNMLLEGDDLVYGAADFRWGWASDFKNATRDELIKAMQEHIVKVMTHFKGRVTQWSVANEVLLNAWHPGDWDHYAEIIGDDYVDIAFRTARQTDPSATLMYNENSNETMSSDRFPVSLPILKRLRSETITLDNGQTVPLVDAIGLQMQMVDGVNPPTKQQLLNAFKAYGDTGAFIIISSMTVDMSNVTGTDEERFAKQAEIFKTVLQACLESKVCTQMNFWGVGDKYNWLEYQQNKPNADATIFDDDLRPKPAYYSIMQVLYEQLP